MRKGCGMLTMLLLIGLGVLCFSPAETTGPTAIDQVTWRQARQVCLDSTHMRLADMSDLGAERVLVEVKDQQHVGQCLTQFGKIQHIAIQPRRR